jgi:hypothetical protein
MPIAPSRVPASAARWKKASTAPIVAVGLVTSIRVVETISSGPLPMTQTNFVPPASTPPYITILPGRRS